MRSLLWLAILLAPSLTFAQPIFREPGQVTLVPTGFHLDGTYTESPFGIDLDGYVYVAVSSPDFVHMIHSETNEIVRIPLASNGVTTNGAKTVRFGMTHDSLFLPKFAHDLARLWTRRGLAGFT
ncbi:MAG: hypothetical protein HY791_02035 [Deltaproteobacteria bacterium]|nr:hypothetical protein [Deltaproteobacteria bacterium]